jgi:hypothetical protein
MEQLKTKTELSDDPILDYYTSVLSLYDTTLNSKAYKRQLNLIEKLESVKIISIYENNEIHKIVKDFLRFNEIIPKGCYQNSAKLSIHNQDVQYVEGFSNCVMPIEHAWNYYNGYYFDMTNEILNLKFTHWSKVKMYSSIDLLSILVKKEQYGPFYQDYIC